MLGNSKKAEDDIKNFHYLVLMLNFSIKAAPCSLNSPAKQHWKQSPKFLRSPGIDSKELIPPKHCELPPVSRIRDVYPGSRILTFIHPRSRMQQQQQKRRV
jgi:hypothetical protein